MRETLLIDVAREMDMALSALEETNFGGEGWVPRWRHLIQELKDEVVRTNTIGTGVRYVRVRPLSARSLE